VIVNREGIAEDDSDEMRSSTTVEPRSESTGPRAGRVTLSLGQRAKWVVPVIGVVLFPLVTQGWSQRTFALDLGGQVAIFAVVLLGLTMLYGWTGQIALGHAAFIGIGAYTTAVVDRSLGVGFEGGGLKLAAVELAAAIGVCAAAGIVVGLPAVRISGLQLVIITFGAGQIFLWFLATYSSFTGGDQGLFVASVSVGGVSTLSVTSRYFVAMAVAWVITALVAQMGRAPIGRAMRVINHSPLAAQSVGVHIARTKLLAFVTSSVLAGIAGWLYAHQLSAVAPGYFVMFTSIYLLAAILIGGIGSLAGAWLGAAYLILVPEAVRSFGGGGNVYTVVSGVLLILVVLFAPRGLADLLGHLMEPARRVASRRSRAVDRDPTVASTALNRTVGQAVGEDSAVTASGSLAVSDVRVAFSGVDVLDHVSLTLSGDVLNGVLGPNGAGKTTLLNVITGYVRPMHGSVRVGEQTIDDWNARQRALQGVARTFQTPRLLESESVRTNLLLGRYRLQRATIVGQSLGSLAHRRFERRDSAAVQEIAQRLGLSRTQLNQSVSDLPAGTRRLVEFGRVLAMEPTTILLDEPIAGLDAKERETVADVLTDYQRSSSTLIVVVEHNVEWVRAVCDHIVILDTGRVLAEGAPDNVLDLPEVRAAYFGLNETTESLGRNA
jgi:branched-chain amino acid transport system permease protein